MRVLRQRPDGKTSASTNTTTISQSLETRASRPARRRTTPHSPTRAPRSTLDNHRKTQIHETQTINQKSVAHWHPHTHTCIHTDPTHSANILVHELTNTITSTREKQARSAHDNNRNASRPQNPPLSARLRLSRHTHTSRVRLPRVDGMLPDSWLYLKYNPLHAKTTTTIATRPQ